MKNWLRRGLRAFEITVIWLVLVALLLEGGTRAGIGLFGTQMQKMTYLASPAALAAANQTFVEMPYLNYGLSPKGEGVNAMGFRSPPFPLEKPPGTFRIVAMGGSTTYGYKLPAADAWPAQLERTLREDYGYHQVQVINAGVPSYTTWHALVNFAFRVLEVQPDLVIVYHGINDTIAMNSLPPDCWRGENTNLGLGNSLYYLPQGLPDVPRSAFVRLAAIRLGMIPNPVMLNGQANGRRITGGVLSGCNPTPLGVHHNPPDYTRRNLRNLAAVAQVNEVPLVLSSWAWRKPSASAPLTPLLVDPGEVNTVIREVAAEFALPLVDMESMLSPQPDFWQSDAIHQTANGSRAQAAIYARFLVETGLLPASR